MSKCTSNEKKPLIYKDIRLIFNDKKKTVGRYDCINLLFLIWRRRRDSELGLRVRIFLPYRNPRRKPHPFCKCKMERVRSAHFHQSKRSTQKSASFTWRRRRDSNSRTVLPVTRFPIVRPRPTRRLLHGRDLFI